MKKIYAILIGLACLLAGGVFCIQLFGASYIGRQITALTGATPLTFKSEPRISLFPPLFSFGAVSWQGSLNGWAASFSATGGNVRPDILSFILGKGRLREVILEKPTLILDKSAEPDSVAASPSRLPALERLVIRDGSLACSGLELANLRLTATQLNTRQEAELQCDFMLSAGSAQIGAVALKSRLHYYAPNITFRAGSAAFTSQDGKLGPLSAQFSGNIALAPHETYPGLNFNVELADVKYHGIVFEDASFRLSGSNGIYRLSDFACGLAGGSLKGRANADLTAGSAELSVQGEKLALATVLAQAGVAGFSGGQTEFSLNLACAAVQDFLAGMSGNGRLECRNLRLEPFGEIALLLPLLGRAAKFAPDLVHRLDVAFTAHDGKITISPISIAGPDVNGTGMAKLNAASGALDARLTISAGDLEIPVEIGGSLNDPSWHIGKPGPRP